MLIVCRKTNGSLQPMDERGEDVLRRIADGDTVTCDVKRPRNIQHHRLFFALLQLVYDNTERFASVDELLDVVKILTGHCRTFRLRDGAEVKIPRSIAFSRMNQDAFNAFFDRAVDAICQEIIPRIDKKALLAEVYEMVGAI